MRKYNVAEHIFMVSLLCLCINYIGFGADLSSTSTGSILKPAILDEFLLTYGIDSSNVVYTMRSTPQRTVLDGPFVVFSTNDTKVAAGSFRDGELDGDMLLWYPNGKPATQQHFENGHLSGAETDWDTDGMKLRTLVWKDGNKNGLEIYTDKTGKISRKIEWKMGLPTAMEIFQDGVLQNRITGTNVMNYYRKMVTP